MGLNSANLSLWAVAMGGVGRIGNPWPLPLNDCVLVAGLILSVREVPSGSLALCLPCPYRTHKRTGSLRLLQHTAIQISFHKGEHLWWSQLINQWTFYCDNLSSTSNGKEECREICLLFAVFCVATFCTKTHLYLIATGMLIVFTVCHSFSQLDLLSFSSAFSSVWLYDIRGLCKGTSRLYKIYILKKPAKISRFFFVFPWHSNKFLFYSIS